MVGLELLREACTAAPELTELAPRLLSLLLESVSLTRTPEAAVEVLEALLNDKERGGDGDGSSSADVMQQLRARMLHDEVCLCGKSKPLS